MARIEDLPNEVLRNICEFLTDAVPFAFASKRCMMAACPVLYSTIYILHTTANALRVDCERWKSRLEKAQSLRHVRCLRLKKAKPKHNIPGSCDILDFGDESLDERWPVLPISEHLMTVAENTLSWKPIVDLMDALPGLTELHYSCWPQLAPCILEAIEKRANFRLFLNTFNLRSLHQQQPKADRVEPYELRLATSPCLRGVITTQFEGLDLFGKVNYIEDAAMAMTSGFAPNLQSVSLCHKGSVNYPSGAFVPKSVLWQGTEFGHKLSSNLKGSLCSLELKGWALCTVEKLRRWAKATDFSKLVTLEIRDGVGTDVLRWLLSEVDLSSIQSLALRFWVSSAPHIDKDETRAELQKLIIAFFKKIPPLRSLQVAEECSYETLAKALQPHTTSLQSLSVFETPTEMRFSSAHGKPIQEQWNCPALKQLAFHIVRTGGDQEEVRQYEWIGKNFPNLRRLFLLVYCAIGCVEENYPLDLENSKFYRWAENRGRFLDLRFILANNAIDGTLAEAIINKISSSKPPGSPPLEYLELDIVTDLSADQYPKDFEKLCQQFLGRGMICNIVYVGDEQKVKIQYSDAVLEENESWIEEEHGESTEVENDRDTNDQETRCGKDDQPAHEVEIDEETLKIFRDLWPVQPGEDWRRCWHSFPLVDTDGEFTDTEET